MNIGILTFHRAVNYGAFLQSYSLCKALNREPDIRAEVIDYSMQSAWNYYDVRAWRLRKKLKSFRQLNYLKKQNTVFMESVNKNKGIFAKEMLVSDNTEEFRNFVKSRYDAIIVGSDEVWKVNSWRRFPNPYFLPGDYGCRKLSYAASFGKSISLTGDDEKRMRVFLNDFELLSVRDQFAYDYLNRNKIGKHVMLSCDPSFLYDFKEELRNCSNPLHNDSIGTDKNKKTVVVMVDKASAEIIRKQLKGTYNLVSLYREQKGYINVTDIDPFSWLKIISEADFVITCYFHGACFSICNNTPFIAIGAKSKQHKFGDLLINTELEKNYLLGDQLDKTNLLAKIEELSGDTSGYEKFASEKRIGFEEYVNLLRDTSLSKYAESNSQRIPQQSEPEDPGRKMPVLENEKLSRYTTIKIGGTAEKMYFPESVEDLMSLYEHEKLHHIISGGSNLLINDRTFDSVVNLKNLNNKFIDLGNGRFEVGASMRLQKLINEINKKGYGGIEYLYSVPGTVGGAIVMNAGRGKRIGTCISDHIVSVKVFRNGKIVELSKAECDFSYRSSVFKTDGSIVISAVFTFPEMGEEESSKAKKDRIEKCRREQDNSQPNFGSVFSTYNLRLMKGIKKLKMGTRHVHFSSKTTNWLLNDGSGSFDEALRTIKKAEKIHKVFGKKIKREVIVWE